MGKAYTKFGGGAVWFWVCAEDGSHRVGLILANTREEHGGFPASLFPVTVQSPILLDRFGLVE